MCYNIHIVTHTPKQHGSNDSENERRRDLGEYVARDRERAKTEGTKDSEFSQGVNANHQALVINTGVRAQLYGGLRDNENGLRDFKSLPHALTSGQNHQLPIDENKQLSQDPKIQQWSDKMNTTIFRLGDNGRQGELNFYSSDAEHVGISVNIGGTGTFVIDALMKDALPLFQTLMGKGRDPGEITLSRQALVTWLRNLCKRNKEERVTLAEFRDALKRAGYSTKSE